MPLWLYRIVEPLADLLAFPLALVLAVRGRYPWWMVTPDDPVSPFGCGTTPGAAREPSMVRVYEKMGRYVGDVLWLGWRNRLYGLSYAMKPDWLKEPSIRYMDLQCVREGNAVVLRQPDGPLLREVTLRLGPFYIIAGHRLSPIIDGKLEDEARVRRGQLPVPRPLRHPNMDGRPVFSIRTKRTM